MAKLFKIYFSESKEKVEETFDKDIGVEKVTIRRSELELLTTLFMLAARFETAPGKALECRDCVEAIGELIKKNKFVEFTKEDLKLAKAGYAKFGGGISYSTIDHCSSLLKQIDSPFDPDVVVVFDHKLNRFKESK